MRNYNKIFQNMAMMFEHGEYILRQTARKMEKDASPLIQVQPKIKIGTNLQFDTVVRKGRDLHSALFLRKENIKEVVEWLNTHPAIDSAFLSGVLSDSVTFTPIAGDITYVAKIRDYIIEEFDGADFWMYSRSPEQFYCEFEIVEE